MSGTAIFEADLQNRNAAGWRIQSGDFRVDGRGQHMVSGPREGDPTGRSRAAVGGDHPSPLVLGRQYCREAERKAVGSVGDYQDK